MNQPLDHIGLAEASLLVKPWRKLPLADPAVASWVRLLRRAIGMSSTQLAKRLGITRQAVVDLEQREEKGAVTLEALRRAAAAMECDLVYALVPKTSLRKVVKAQALARARTELAGLAEEEAVQQRAEELAATMPRELWEG